MCGQLGVLYAATALPPLSPSLPPLSLHTALQEGSLCRGDILLAVDGESLVDPGVSLGQVGMVYV